ncbi:MAG: isochorismatase family protein [Lentisphaeria bacterium]|nr:isochorismatase family protein [Lentisphaeria bacterium]
MSFIPQCGSSKLILIDVQEKLVPAMNGFETAAEKIRLLLAGAGELSLPVIATEQYPRGLGATRPEFAELLPEGTPVIAKTGFSVFEEPLFVDEVRQGTPETLIFCGIESHVCVFQSVMDSLAAGYNTILAGDAVASRKTADRDLAIAQMQAAGAMVVSSEAILFMLLRDASHPAFKAVSKLVR